MQRCGLTVQISTKLNRAHLVTGERALILPCLGRTERDVQLSGEQFVTVENSMGVVSKSRGSLEPASPHLRSEPAILCELATALFGSNKPFDWLAARDNYDVIRNHIEAVIPGFDRYNDRVRQPDGFYLPNGPRQGKFTTTSGKALFTYNPLPDIRVKEGRLVMMTIRSHDQYNTTIYGLDDRYRGIKNERRVVLMHADDMRAMHLQEHELVNLVGEFNGVIRRAEQFHALPFSIPRGCCATYFPETNCLVPIDSYADRSKTPVSKFIEISIEKR
jgi:anaerobic selenocysteine-containing dehydrogenase